MQAKPVEGWTFTEEGHTFRDKNGSPVPSLTQILDSVGIVDYSSVPEGRLAFKRDIGDAVHYATKYRDLDTLDYSTVQPQWANYLVAWEQFLEDTGFVPEEIEKPGVYSYSGMVYGCIIDRIGRFPGIKHRALVEIKCAYAEEPSWAIQLAGQELSIAKAENEFIARIAVQLKPDRTYKIFPDLNGYQDPNDVKVFLWSLCVVQWKMKHGISWRNGDV